MITPPSKNLALCDIYALAATAAHRASVAKKKADAGHRPTTTKGGVWRSDIVTDVGAYAAKTAPIARIFSRGFFLSINSNIKNPILLLLQCINQRTTTLDPESLDSCTNWVRHGHPSL
jgi:hypothetical protein